MSAAAYPWSVPVAGALLLFPAGIAGVVYASEHGPARLVGLASVAVVAAVAIGLLARRRWAVRAGFALVPVGVVLTVLAFREDTGAGRMMAYVTVLYLLLLSPALWRRRHRAQAAPDVQDAAPPGTPPSLRDRLMFGVFAVPTVLGVMFLLMLPALASSSDVLGAVPGLVAVVLFFGAGMVLVRPRRRPARLDLARLSIDGADMPAFLARYDRLGRAAVPAGAIGAAIIGVLILVEAGLPAIVWVCAAVLCGLAATALLVAAVSGWRSYVALVPSGLHVPGPRRAAFVPWDSVERAFLQLTYTRGGAEPFVAVSVSDPAAIRLSTAGRLLRLANRRFGADLFFPARVLAVEPELLVHAIEVYRSSPERREEIGTAEGLERLRAAWDGSAMPAPRTAER
jgi:hypothetical protein